MQHIEHETPFHEKNTTTSNRRSRVLGAAFVGLALLPSCAASEKHTETPSAAVEVYEFEAQEQAYIDSVDVSPAMQAVDSLEDTEVVPVVTAAPAETPIPESSLGTILSSTETIPEAFDSLPQTTIPESNEFWLDAEIPQFELLGCEVQNNSGDYSTIADIHTMMIEAETIESLPAPDARIIESMQYIYDQLGITDIGELVPCWQIVSGEVHHGLSNSVRGFAVHVDKKVVINRARVEHDSRVNSLEEVTRTMAHEIGHAFDIEHMTNEDRLAYMQLRGMSEGTVWFAHTDVDDVATGAGDFAETFSQVIKGDFEYPNRTKVATPELSVELATYFENLIRNKTGIELPKK